MVNYHQKYIKYKAKYLELKKQIGGFSRCTLKTKSNKICKPENSKDELYGDCVSVAKNDTDCYFKQKCEKSKTETDCISNFHMGKTSQKKLCKWEDNKCIEKKECSELKKNNV